MNQLAAQIIATPSSLSVSYKSSPLTDDLSNAIPEAVVTTDPDFYVTGLNKVAESMYGFTSVEATGKKIFDLVPFEMIGTSLDAAIEILFNNGFWRGDLIYSHFNKKVIFSTRCTLIKDANGKDASIIIITHNISEKLRQETELAVAEYKYDTLVESLAEGVVLINSDGTINKANKKTAEMFGLSSDKLVGDKLFPAGWNTIKEDGSSFPSSEYPAFLSLKNGLENNNVIMGLEHEDGKKIWVSINSHPIFGDHIDLPVAVMVSMIEITEIKKVNEQLSQSEQLFRTFMKHSPTLGWIYDEDESLVYGNPKFLELIISTENKNIDTKNPGALLSIILEKNKEILKDENPLIVEDEFIDKDGRSRSYIFYLFLLPISKNKKLIGGHAVEITENKNAYKELDKMFERYTFAINASSDAIWDIDISTQMIYHSDTFNAFTGYSKIEIEPTLDWFFEKIHPDDKKRIKSNIDNCLKNNITHWENEYRFKMSDGTYRSLLDKALAIYEEGKLTRVIGAMQDITERKKMELQLVEDQVQQQKMVNQVIIQAQETERNRISGELHDNVNQLLTSAKLHICVAKNRLEGDSELLDKANQYLLMAVEEIRNLSKTLNSSVITNGGLLKSINEIGANMLLLKNIRLQVFIEELVLDKMSLNQQMTIYRIIQEQSNNILKYADTKEAIISLKIVNNNFELIISDSGQGFDKKKQKASGIGLINIFNRVDAYNGKVEIITSPGNGCTILINFPIAENKLLN